MPDEAPDLSFSVFGGSKRLYPAPGIFGDDSESSNPLKNMARREGFEPPPLRFEEESDPQEEHQVALKVLA